MAHLAASITFITMVNLNGITHDSTVGFHSDFANLDDRAVCLNKSLMANLSSPLYLVVLDPVPDFPH